MCWGWNRIDLSEKSIYQSLTSATSIWNTKNYISTIQKCMHLKEITIWLNAPQIMFYFNRVVDTSSELGTPQHVKVFAVHCIVFVKLTSNLHCKVCRDHKSWPLVPRWPIYFQFYDISLRGVVGVLKVFSLCFWFLMSDPCMIKICLILSCHIFARYLGGTSWRRFHEGRKCAAVWSVELMGTCLIFAPFQRSSKFKVWILTLIFLDSLGIWMFCVAPGRKNLCSVLR